MRVVRVSLSLLAALVGGPLTALPCAAALGPQPAFGDSYGAFQPVRERAERLTDAASGRFSALKVAQEDPRGEAAEPAGTRGGSDLASLVMDWLERAAYAYQAQVIEKLSVSVAAAAGDERSPAPEAPAAGIGEWLKETVRSAFGWLQGWVGAGPSGHETAEDASKSPGAPAGPAGEAKAAAETKAPPTPGSSPSSRQDDPPQQIAANDRSDEDARDFVEARRKADEALKEAQRLAEAREKTSEEKRRAEADLERRKEEAEIKAREDARKAEMARQHDENERRIRESLRKLDEAHQAAEEKRREAERAKAEEEARKAAADKRAALEAEEAAQAQRVAEEGSRKAEEEKRIEEERTRAAKKSEDERVLALTSPPKAERAPESAGAAPAGMPATPPPVRADIMPGLRLPSTRANAADATAPVPGAAGKKVPAQTKTATSEPAPAAQPKASESAASEAKPKKVEHRKSARQQPAKRAKAQRRAREARGARRPAKLVYVVRPGDTLSAIAERYLGSGRRYDVIYRANRHRIKSPNVIHARQRIVVPLRKA